MSQRQYKALVYRNMKRVKHNRACNIIFLKHNRLPDYIYEQTTQKPHVMVQEQVSSRARPLASRGTPLKIDPGSKIKE